MDDKNEIRTGRESFTPGGGTTKGTFVALTPNERQWLRQLANREGRSLSGQIRHIIRNFSVEEARG